ncbi:MAG TPA: hypothetical protein O0X32_00570 [Methanocorpusculum sp.]|nr:hypothetical protein [Methanocorpusculum sp.]
MRPRPPTLREKRRYILIKIEGFKPTQKEIYKEIAESVSDLFGDTGAAKMHPTVIESEGMYAIVRCNRGTECEVTAAIACITHAGGNSVVFRTVRTSGTILGVKKGITDGEEISYHTYKQNRS